MRIDHGVRCEDDPGLVDRLVRDQIALTMCPLSNVKLRVFPDLAHHPLKKLLDAGLCATVNSDDPAYFGGYIGENYRATAAALELTAGELVALADNAVRAAFLPDDAKAALLARIRSAAAQA